MVRARARARAVAVTPGAFSDRSRCWTTRAQVAYLAGVTKSISTLNDLSDKIILAFNAHRRI